MIYRRLADTGTAPSREELDQLLGSAADAQLRALHDAHMIVLDDRPHRRGEVRMALPFSAEPTDYRVSSATGSWFANCAWDSLAVVAAIKQDARIDAPWGDTGESLTLQVRDGQLLDDDGFIHFVVPARHWWDDIVRT